MDATAYARFEAQIEAWATACPDVIGFVVAGAGARRSHYPDEWSDHDVWIVARPNTAESLRRGTWVPDPERIVLRYRESRHGTNIVYDDGHLVELAVFEPEELALARVNDFRVVAGNEALQGSIETLERATRDEAESQADGDALFGRFISRLIIGVSRYGRGERLSAHVNVRSGALDALVRLITAYVPPESAAPLDNLDPMRRFDRAYPKLNARLLTALDRPLLEVAEALLAEATGVLATGCPGFNADAVKAVETLVTRARAVQTG